MDSIVSLSVTFSHGQRGRTLKGARNTFDPVLQPSSWRKACLLILLNSAKDAFGQLIGASPELIE